MPANRLAELRQEHSLSQAALALERGVTASTVWRWENGRVTVPDPQKVALAGRFGVTVGYLMGWEAAHTGAAA